MIDSVRAHCTWRYTIVSSHHKDWPIIRFAIVTSSGTRPELVVDIKYSFVWRKYDKARYFPIGRRFYVCHLYFEIERNIIRSVSLSPLLRREHSTLPISSHTSHVMQWSSLPKLFSFNWKFKAAGRHRVDRAPFLFASRDILFGELINKRIRSVCVHYIVRIDIVKGKLREMTIWRSNCSNL